MNFKNLLEAIYSFFNFLNIIFRTSMLIFSMKNIEI
jgi:hypothetical protein